MIPMSQRRAQSTPVPRSEEPSGNVTKSKPFFERNAITIFQCELWGTVILYTTMYATLGASRFLPGALPFLFGVASATHLPYAVLSPVQQRSALLSKTNQKLFAMFPAACVTTVFGGAGLRLWIWTAPPKKSIPAVTPEQDATTWWMDFSHYCLLVLTAILVTAIAWSLISFWLHSREKEAKPASDTPESAAATSTSSTPTGTSLPLNEVHSANLLFRSCIVYAIRHLVLDLVSVLIAAFASNHYARGLVDAASDSTATGNEEEGNRVQGVGGN